MKSLTTIDPSLNEFLSGFKKHLEKTYKVDLVDKNEEKRICGMLDISYLLSDYKGPTFINCYKIEKENIPFICYLIHVLKNYKASPKKYHHGHYDDMQLIGLIQVKDCTHIFIKPEKISEKLQDVFLRVELDFHDHPEFSSKYYVLAFDKEEATAKLNLNFFDALNKLGEPYVEIQHQHLLVKFKRDSTFKDADMIVSFLEEVNKNKLLGLQEGKFVPATVAG